MNRPSPNSRATDGGTTGCPAELTRAEALELLAGTGIGRIVFTRDGLPAIRPVDYVLDDDEIVMRTRRETVAGAGSGAGAVVAFQADRIEAFGRPGWSVAVTGYARAITDPEALARYDALLEHRVAFDADCTVGLRVEIFEGFRLR